MKIEVKLDYRVMKLSRGPCNKYLMKKFAEELGTKEQVSMKLNRVRKHQEAVFMSGIATASGIKVNSVYANDSKGRNEGKIGRHRPELIFGMGCPTKEN